MSIQNVRFVTITRRKGILRGVFSRFFLPSVLPMSLMKASGEWVCVWFKVGEVYSIAGKGVVCFGDDWMRFFFRLAVLTQTKNTRHEA
jgi:hypothetical protein